MGDVGCLGVLPLRLMGAEEEETIGKTRSCGCVFLIVWVRLRKICRCHCGVWYYVCVKTNLPCSGSSIDVF